MIGGGPGGDDPGGDDQPGSTGPNEPIGGLLPTLTLLAAGIALSSGMLLVARRRRRPRDEAADTTGTTDADGSPVRLAPPLPQPTPARLTLVPTSPPIAGAVAHVDPTEAGIPRWRRQSLKDARFKSDSGAAPTPQRMSFGSAARTGVERSVVRYDLAPLLDSPDQVTGLPVADLRGGDEVDVIGRRGVWAEVRTPRGVVGWVHRTTLAAVEIAPLETSGPEVAEAAAGDQPADEAIEPEALDRMLAAIVAQRQAAAELATVPTYGAAPVDAVPVDVAPVDVAANPPPRTAKSPHAGTLRRAGGDAPG